MQRNGTAAWLGQPQQEDLQDGTALLKIETKTGSHVYWVYHNGTRSRLKKMNDGTTYEVLNGKCNCPDAVHRQTDCKHARALNAALPLVRS